MVDMIEAPDDGCRSYFDDALTITRDFNARYAKLLAKSAKGKEVLSNAGNDPAYL
jgi:hypothetical protein